MELSWALFLQNQDLKSYIITYHIIICVSNRIYLYSWWRPPKGAAAGLTTKEKDAQNHLMPSVENTRNLSRCSCTEDTRRLSGLSCCSPGNQMALQALNDSQTLSKAIEKLCRIWKSSLTLNLPQI